MAEGLRNREFDEYGLLKNPEDWSPELARQLAANAGIGYLTEPHRAFLRLLRAHYRKFHAPPPPHKVCYDLHLPRNCGIELFDTCLAAWRIAGLPDPGEKAEAYTCPRTKFGT